MPKKAGAKMGAITNLRESSYSPFNPETCIWKSAQTRRNLAIKLEL
jgi:hypothetical protein